VRNGFIALLFLCSCQHNNSNATAVKSQNTTPVITSDQKTVPDPLVDKTLAVVEPTTSKYSFKILEFSEGKFGYDIYLDDAKFIHQETIPAAQGETNFSFRKDAEKLAQLVIHKLTIGIMPPGVTLNELDSLKIKYKK
jgi:hypothetical protein